MKAYIIQKERVSESRMTSEFDEQLSKLLEKEKIARVNNEHFTSVLILKDIITLCFKSLNWVKLNEMIAFLMNRRGQGKKAQIQMIQLAMTWLNAIAEPHRTTLIENIRDVCAKKIFLEVEYARCVLMIVKTKENENDILEAASILQEVQVETYGSMDKREKLEFILYQLKIMIKKKDYVRFFIISKKINENNINDDDITDIKVQFYAYMSFYWNHQKNFKQSCRCYRILWTTIKSTKKILPETFDFGFSINLHNIVSNYIGFLALQEMKELSESEEMQKYIDAVHLINSFLSEEVVKSQLEDYRTERFELFCQEYHNSAFHLCELKRMLVQHNIRVVSKYYSNLSLRRLAALINAEASLCEEQLCKLNNDKLIACKIDRIDDLICFNSEVNQEDGVLSQWNLNINEILGLVDVASNLIHREREVYKK